jgi:hypothetical protein
MAGNPWLPLQVEPRVLALSAYVYQRGVSLLLANWVRRCENFIDEAGRYYRAQLTNAYAIIQPSQWRGYSPAPEAPPPQPGTWGDHPPLPDQLTLATDELRHGARRTALAMLEAGDDLARALASYARSVGFTGLPD